MSSYIKTISLHANRIAPCLTLLVCLALAAGMLFVLSACSAAPEEEEPAPPAQLSNPVKEVASPAAVNEQLGINLVIPLDASIKMSAVIGDTVGEVTFQLNRVTYTYRGMVSTQSEDISGLYYDFDESKETTIAGRSVVIKLVTRGPGYSRWYDANAGITYSVSVENSGTEELLTTITKMLITEQTNQ